MAKRVLEEIRVISMGSLWAGPYIGRVLAEHGAEVFRVEPLEPVGTQPRIMERPPEMLEAWKKTLLTMGVPKENIEAVGTRSAGYGAVCMANHYSVGMNLENDKGKELFKKLAAISDVVLVGYSPRVMTNLGLDYPVLRQIKPDLIMIHIPGLGMTGPEKDARMLGSGCEALSGLQSITGYFGGDAHRAAGFIPDGLSPPFAVIAIVAALIYRAETGKGQFIDLAQTETVSCILGEAIMDYTMNKRIAQPMGNRHPYYAPHGCYRCKGDDMWVTIAVTSEAEWHRFCKAIGDPEWARSEKFADMLSRWHNQDELDKSIEEWTVQHDHYAVQEILQQAGVAAGAVLTMEEHILRDPHIKDRHVYQWITFHDSVADPVHRVPWILPRTPTSLDRRGPYRGEHNEYVLGTILGMSKEEM